jgi:hypothetical protein
MVAGLTPLLALKITQLQDKLEILGVRGYGYGV